MKTTLAAVLALAVVALIGPTPAASATKRTLYPCQDQTGFSSTTLTIVTSVKPSYNQTWVFAEAPSVVATRILANLNNNSANVTFKEANGVVPNLYINVTLTESNSGTQQDSAYAAVTGLAKPGTLFNATSGNAPYIGWKDAVDHLSTDMLEWLTGGWHSNPPCRRPDGSTRTQWPDTGGSVPRSK
jgi:hypothetical protein